MGVSCSCPLAVYCDFDTNLESVLVNSINLEEDDRNNPKDSESKTLQSLGSGRLLVKGSFKLRAGDIQTMKFNKRTNFCVWPRLDSLVGPNSPKHEAALKLQKVYKSFRTRRRLADCAVLIEHSWWKLLDFAELKHSSISFFDLDKHESAISRWSRARTRAAKVGKGLSKNSKAQKLALQHWLEAIDPRHRYGHNLHFYYINWLNSQSKEPFFYWLDIGEGKEVNLIEKCPRSKLQQQCIKYLGPCERKAYEILMEDGKLFYSQTGEFLNTTNEPKGSKWIFVLSTSKTLYVGKKKKGSFQHSSFLAGGATLAAGRVVAENGVLKAIWPHSGHYRPTPENFQDFISFLRENNVDLTDVKLDSIDDEEDYSVRKQGSVYLRNNSSEDELTGKKDRSETEETEKSNPENESAVASPSVTTLQIPGNTDFFEQLKSENKDDESSTSNFPLESPMDEYETQEFLAPEEDIIPEESILRRISSHKETKSFQLGKQLSCKWSTGAGPRIGCVRDYPSGLQYHALEQVNLSPRSERRLRSDYPSRGSTPNSSFLSRSMRCNP